jgi:hypothetical protein
LRKIADVKITSVIDVDFKYWHYISNLKNYLKPLHIIAKIMIYGSHITDKARGKMKKLVSYGTIFILGSGAGWILSGKHWEIFYTSYVPALATLIAAFYGAKYAFQFQNKKEDAKNRENNLLNGNLAIYNLMRMANTLFVYRKQFIEPVREKSTAFLEMPPSLELLEDDIKFSMDNLFFLLQSDEINFIGELAVEKSRFQRALDAINERSRIHRLEVQPALEKAGVVQGGDYTFQQIESILGDRLNHTIRQATDQVINSVDETIISLNAAADKLSKILKAIFPGERIIGFDFKK